LSCGPHEAARRAVSGKFLARLSNQVDLPTGVWISMRTPVAGEVLQGRLDQKSSWCSAA
jgi:hypothetical protein